MPPSATTSEASTRSWQGLTPPLSEWIVDAVTSMGLKRMTPVQASTIPLFTGNKDVVVEAVTGSGKTLAYLIPVIERLLRVEEPLKKHHVAAIIVSPTRELAAQIHGVLQNLLAFHGPSAAAMETADDDGELLEDAAADPTPAPLYPSSTLKVVPQLLVGGMTTPAQDLSRFLKNSPNLLISTPGRLLEILSSPHVHCPQSSFEVLVLDEADRLLDLGFKDDLQKILGRLPKQRRTGLFSASVSEAVDQIVRVGLRNPVKISVKVRGTAGGADQMTPASLQMSYLMTPASHKLPAVSQLLLKLEPLPYKSIIYLSTCAAVDYFQHVLPSILPSRYDQPFSLIPLHGKQRPNVRQKNFDRYVNSITPAILLTTDVAARGLDIPQVDLVMQIDLPSDPKVYLHRCGRAGRAGRKGLSVIFLQTGREEEYISFLEIRKTPVSPLAVPVINVSNEEASTAAETIRKVVKAERSLHDKAQRAFVSWLRAYSKHQASSIFRVADIDWADVGQAWGLLKLPKMPELKAWEGDKTLGVKIDFATFAYQDKQAEEARKAAQKEREERVFVPRDEQSREQKATKRAWSQKLDAKDLRELRREKKATRRAREKWELMTEEEREKQKELEALIEAVKRRRAEEDQLEEFEGFEN